MTDLERSALLWLLVFMNNPTRPINAGMLQLYGVSRRRSHDVLRHLKKISALTLQRSIGNGSKWVVNKDVAKALIKGLDSDGTRPKTSGW
jgi:hypothetical protein